jgi:hypothetical protein
MTSPSHSNIKNKIQQINDQIEDKKLIQMVNLSKRSLPITIILSIFFPIGGYIYTRRWLPFIGFMLGGFLLASVVYASENDQQKADNMTGNLCFLYGAVVAPLDNGKAISRARERLSDLSQ